MGGRPSCVLRGGDGWGALYQGGKAALEGTWLEDNGIGASVSLGSLAVDGIDHPCVKRRVCATVGDVPSSAGCLAARLPDLVKFVVDARTDGINVLVHCAQGVSRSSFVVIGYAVATGVVPDVATAMSWLSTVRPQTKPNAGLAAELDALELRVAVPDALLRIDRASVREVAPDDKTTKLVRFAASMRKVSTRAALRSVAEAAANECLWRPASVDRVRVEDLSPAMFARDYVAASHPVVFLNRRTMTIDDFAAAAGAVDITVSATPDGRADAIAPDGRFAKPEQRTMTLNDLLVDDGADVLYYSAQNDCLRNELPEVAGEFAAPPLDAAYLEALAARGTSTPVLEAVNCWIGDGRSVTTAHADRAYDNFYLVLDGMKTFYVLPPTALAWLPVRRCRQATWSKNTTWTLVDDDPVAWVEWLDCGDLATLSDHACAPLIVTLEPGDLLYLPAGWVHQVDHQSHRALAVNWWYEARFDDARWAACHLASQIGRLAREDDNV